MELDPELCFTSVMERELIAKRPGYSSNERILDILLAFGESGGIHSVHEVAKRFELSRSSAYRYLQILRRRGFVEETDQAGLFRLGPTLRHLGRRVSGEQDLIGVARPIMMELARDTGESVLLTKRVGLHVAVLAAIDSPQVVRAAIDAARNVPLYAGSFAKLHLAFLPPTEREEILARPLDPLTSEARLDATALRGELREIRERGYAVSESEIELGMCSVSVPIVGDGGTLLAVLSIAGPSFRLKRAQLTAFVPRLVEAVRAVTEAWEGGDEAPAGRALAETGS